MSLDVENRLVRPTRTPRADSAELTVKAFRSLLRRGWIVPISSYRYRVSPSGIKAMQRGHFHLNFDASRPPDLAPPIDEPTGRSTAANMHVITLELGGVGYDVVFARRHDGCD